MLRRCVAAAAATAAQSAQLSRFPLGPLLLTLPTCLPDHSPLPTLPKKPNSWLDPICRCECVRECDVPDAMIRQFQQARSLVPVLPDASCTERLTTLTSSSVVHVRSFCFLCRIFCAAMEGTSVRFLFFAEVGGRCCLERISLSVCLSVCLVCLACPHWSLLRFKRGREGGWVYDHLIFSRRLFRQVPVYILLVFPLVFFSTLLLFTSLTLHSLERLQQQQQHQYCLRSLHTQRLSLPQIQNFKATISVCPVDTKTGI